MNKEELYCAFSSLEDMVMTTKGTEGHMRSAIRNNIRGAERHLMIQNVVQIQRKRFMELENAALICSSPVPPVIEKHLA